MTLEIIGAGFGRTGTESMKLALETLGFGPCHHMKEVLPSYEKRLAWTEVAHGATPDWDALFEGYRSAVDWPSAYYWRETAAFYPDAKVLLTVRSPESWYASFSSTILKVLGKNPIGPFERSLGARLIGDLTFDGRPDDPEHAMAVFRRNIDAVVAEIAPERLLVHELGSGWEPLCAFLGVPVPDTPYPRTNDGQQFHESYESRAAAGASPD